MRCFERQLGLVTSRKKDYDPPFRERFLKFSFDEGPQDFDASTALPRLLVSAKFELNFGDTQGQPFDRKKLQNFYNNHFEILGYTHMTNDLGKKNNLELAKVEESGTELSTFTV